MVDVPEENEVVLATVRKIIPYGVFCLLPEYNNTEAFLHVSEVASRWIKNIREFVSENDKIVVKILHVDHEKGQIDISLRRVNEEEKRNKLESIKRTARSKKLLQLALQKSKVPMKLEDLSAKLEEIYGEAYWAFEAILENDNALAQVQLPEPLKKEIVEIVCKSIRKARVSVGAEFTLKCFGSKGIEDIKQLIGAALTNEQDIIIRYLGAPRYGLECFSSNYKDANKKLEKIINKLQSSIPKDCVFEYKVEV